jgi:hypothetical protein
MWMEIGSLVGAITAVIGFNHDARALEIVGLAALVVFQCFALRFAWRWSRRNDAPSRRP